jgi:hypothetical protein
VLAIVGDLDLEVLDCVGEADLVHGFEVHDFHYSDNDILHTMSKYFNGQDNKPIVGGEAGIGKYLIAFSFERFDLQRPCFMYIA